MTDEASAKKFALVVGTEEGDPRAPWGWRIVTVLWSDTNGVLGERRVPEVGYETRVFYEAHTVLATSDDIGALETMKARADVIYMERTESFETIQSEHERALQQELAGVLHVEPSVLQRLSIDFDN